MAQIPICLVIRYNFEIKGKYFPFKSTDFFSKEQFLTIAYNILTNTTKNETWLSKVLEVSTFQPKIFEFTEYFPYLCNEDSWHNRHQIWSLCMNTSNFKSMRFGNIYYCLNREKLIALFIFKI